MFELPLTNGGVALIDYDDRELLRHFNWHYIDAGNGRYYAETNYMGFRLRMHRLIMDVWDSKVLVDHAIA